MADAIPAYPDDSLQSVVGTWWVEDQQRAPGRGRLVRAFVPHVDQDPMTLVAEGRAQPTAHGAFTARLETLRISAPRRDRPLPVAALPDFPGEARTVYRAKTRPALILGLGGPEIPRELRTGAAGWQSAPALLVAPYYGADPGGTRGGWRPELVARIRRCEYPQYLWDRLPLPGAAESILRLDHLQPIGRHANAYEWTPYRLSPDALALVDEWLTWIITDRLPPDGLLADIRRELMKLPATTT